MLPLLLRELDEVLPVGSLIRIVSGSDDESKSNKKVSLMPPVPRFRVRVLNMTLVRRVL